MLDGSEDLEGLSVGQRRIPMPSVVAVVRTWGSFQVDLGMTTLQFKGVVDDVGEVLGETLSRLSRVESSSDSSWGGGLEGGVGLRRNCRRIALGAA